MCVCVLKKHVDCRWLTVTDYQTNESCWSHRDSGRIMLKLWRPHTVKNIYLTMLPPTRFGLYVFIRVWTLRWRHRPKYVGGYIVQYITSTAGERCAVFTSFTLFLQTDDLQIFGSALFVSFLLRRRMLNPAQKLH